RVVAIAGDRGGVAGELEVEGEPGRDRVVILDDQDPAGHGASCSAATEATAVTRSRRRLSRMRNVVAPGCDSKSSLPRWPRTIALTNDRPRPRPAAPLVSAARPRWNCSKI